MLAWSFSLFEVWYVPTFFLILFLYKIVTSVYMAGDHFAANPLFDKKQTKYILQQNINTSNSVLPVVIFSATVLFIKNNDNCANFWTERFLPFSFLLVFLFLKLIKMCFFDVKNGDAEQLINSGFTFLLILPLITLLITSAVNLIDFLLPLEVLGMLLYFVVLESTDKKLSNNKNASPQSEIFKIRNLVYYFWLNFVGTMSFIIAIVISFITLPSLSLQHFQNFLHLNSYKTTVVICTFILVGFTIKMGGMFFFFFKAEIYKTLDNTGILIFSIISSIFYLFVFVFLCAISPYIMWTAKYSLFGITTCITVYLLFIGSLEQQNIYVFFGLSSVLNILFSLLTVV